MNEPEIIELPEGVTVEMKKGGKAIPIISLTDLKEKIAAERVLAKREAEKSAQQKAALEELNQAKEEKLKKLEVLVHAVYSEMLSTHAQRDGKSLHDLNVQVEHWLNAIFLPHAMPGYRALLTVRHETHTTTDGRIIVDADMGTTIEFLTEKEYEKVMMEHPVPALISKSDAKKIGDALDSAAKKPSKKSKK